jgi:hypothetical protein
MGNRMMRSTYYPQDDILEIRFSDKPVVREVSQDWNVNVSYADDGSIVELVILDTVKSGLMPFHSGEERHAA